MNGWLCLYLIVGLILAALMDFGMRIKPKGDDEQLAQEIYESTPWIHGIVLTLSIVTWPFMICLLVWCGLEGKKEQGG